MATVAQRRSGPSSWVLVVLVATMAWNALFPFLGLWNQGHETYITTQQRHLAVSPLGDVLSMGLVEESIVPPDDNDAPPFPPRRTERDTCTLAQTDFRQAAGLFAIVTGMEHSGTTLLSELIMSAPHVFGAFESGFLLDPSPATFGRQRRTFYQWSIQPVTESLHWGLTAEQRDGYVMRAACFAEMYRRVHESSPLLKQPSRRTSTKDQTNTTAGNNEHLSSWIVDKTPSYLYNLTRIMDLTPAVPVVVTVKDDDAQFQSLVKRGVKRAGARRRIQAGQDALQAARAVYPDRLYVVNMTALYQNPHAVLQPLFDWLGLTWHDTYLTMQAFNDKGKPLGRCQVPPFDANTQNTKAVASKVVGNHCQDNNGFARERRRNKTKKQK